MDKIPCTCGTHTQMNDSARLCPLQHLEHRSAAGGGKRPTTVLDLGDSVVTHTHTVTTLLQLRVPWLRRKANNI